MTKFFPLLFNSIALLGLMLSLGCNSRSSNDFIEVSEDVKLKIISFNTQSNLIEDGDLIEFKSISLKNNHEKLLADSAKMNELFNDTITYRSKINNNLLSVLSKLQEGDSCLALFYGVNKKIECLSKANHLTKNDTVYTYIKIKRIYKGNEKLAYQLEENAIARYITFSNQAWKASENGIYYRILKPSNSAQLKFNDPIKLVYKGYFLNMQVFDNYAAINPYFEHKIGTQNQLITGMEYALKLMSYGTEAEFIFPSSLAFGKQGSSTGIVPAFKPLLYKVKILDKEAL
jgi:FKBP-type peptidyl-prolyl cis-trans isomerase